MITKQRGSAWSIKLVFNLYKIFGYTFIYFLMYPVTFFYFIFASNVKKSLEIYYQRLEKPFTNAIYYRHLRYFAMCMVDRFISKFAPQSYVFEYAQKKAIKEIFDSGALLLMSHYGGWASTSNAPITQNKINIVMKEVLLDGIKAIEDSLPLKVNNIDIIDLNKSGLEVSIKIANALLDKEIVAMMGDRSNDSKYNVGLPFLGDIGFFNKNPFQIAYKTQKPIVVLFAILKGMRHYQIECLIINMNQNLKQEESIHDAMTLYVNYYEKILQQNPQQWFNFYNFWEKK
ncbi:MAG: lipid A biosynthesis acyltransferase [Candidatus Marinarcus sp.]|uniref:LpxL/LpxP family acyltransferase n=1 Tax=Candidatus Marinarcus sp. TaxID=3100987 RepID=UPI003B005B4C